jgi:orotidine-5'-phosphate decarboxylase
VVHYAGLARKAGLDGVVASAREIKIIRAACPAPFIIVTPGIRPAWASSNDQKRIMTPERALRAGADYLVIGRPITAANNPEDAAGRILDEIAGVRLS